MKNKRKSQIDWERIHQSLEGDPHPPAPGNTPGEDEAMLLKEIGELRSAAAQLEGWEEVNVEDDWAKVKAHIGLPAAAPVIPLWRKTARYAAIIALPLAMAGALWLFIKHRRAVPGRLPIAYTTLQTAKGQQPLRVTLSDGSTVWLNAGSSLRYPSVFTGTAREVEMAGEASFSITPNARQPFIAKTNDLQVLVLGTLFNINAYNENIVTTLVSGKIAVSLPGGHHDLPGRQHDDQQAQQIPEQPLIPGQQAIYNSRTGSLTINTVDPQYTLAWQHGQLAFSNMPLSDLLQQLGRLYNYEIIFRNEKWTTQHYNVPLMPRPETIIPLLELIKSTLSQPIHFEIDSVKRNITVE